MNTELLSEIGLTDSEIKVYMGLLKLGSSKKGPIVKEAGITSSKIYEVVDKLIEKGLASYVLKDGIKYFNAASPSRIKDYLREKEQRVKKQEKALEKALPELELMKHIAGTETDAEVYRGWKGMQTVYGELLNTLSPDDRYYVFGASKGMDEEKVRAFFTRFNNGVIRRKLQGKIIFNENARGNIANAEQTGEIRYLDHTTPSEIIVYLDRTAIVLLDKEPLVVLVRGKSIAQSFRSYFEIMWKIAKD